MRPKKLWSGRFAQSTDAAVDAFSASLAFDRILYRYDIKGSIAHCRMLGRQRIISARDAKKIIAALHKIEQEIERGRLPLRPEVEDIHMLIESRLIQKIGPVGGALHTARSRNDQVALDVSMYLRDAILDTVCLVDNVQNALIAMAAKNRDVILPGYTHLQHAQPVLLAHHVLAYFEMLQRDRTRLEACYGRANVLPLGAGALAGTPHPIDREYVAGLLGYPAVTANSMDTVSDRDALIEYCSCAAVLMMHLSRFCEELIIWSSAEFQFVEISDAFCTGSSIMPQKKNPDVPELVRGKTGRVYGNLMALLTIMKALPLTYNRDLQEDKEALFDTVVTTGSCLNIFALMLPQIRVNRQAMAAAAQRGFLTATDLADYLVAKGVPFRTAHETVGGIVAYCLKAGKHLGDLSPQELRGFSSALHADALQSLSLLSSINSRRCTGGTSATTVKKALAGARAAVRRGRRFIDQAAMIRTKVAALR